MDASCNMDILDDSSALPELSFDDLLDPSPVKKKDNYSNSQDDSDNHLDSDMEAGFTIKRDDSLNTPGPKKPQQQMNVQSGRTAIPITSNSISSKPTPIRINTIKPGPIKTSVSTGGNPPPVLLNTKNVLPKTATQMANNSNIMITPKVTRANATVSGGGGVAGTSTAVSLAGKTAVRTSTGQIIYIQKSTTTSTSSSASSGIGVKPQPVMLSSGNSSSGTANKPMTIQVLRRADGNFVTVKSTPTPGGTTVNKTTTVNKNATVNKNTTLTLSPTLAGKKIVSTSALSSNTTSLPTMNVKTVSKTTSGENVPVKPKTIVVQSTSGKHIVLSNQNLVKLSPKTQSGTATTTTTTSTIQIAGKPGVQYVRVIPNAKVVPAKSMNATASGGSTATTNTISLSQSSVKILNNLPQQFTVLQKGTATKVVLTQKKDSTTGESTPVVSKMEKTIVTGSPTIKPLNNDDNKTVANSAQQALVKSVNNQTALVRKHKISQINSEIKRLTTAEQEESEQPEVKKVAPNSRLVLISSNNAPKLLNNSAGRLTTVSASGAIQVQGTKLMTTSSTATTKTVTTASKPLYTILKPSTSQQSQSHQTKVYNVVKSNTIDGLSKSATSTSTTNAKPLTASDGQQKPLINKQSLMLQQQKMLQLKQLQKPITSQATSTTNTFSLSSSAFLNVKIKEEPLDFLSENNADQRTTASSSKLNYAAASSSSFAAPANLPPLPSPPSRDAEDLANGIVRRKHCNCSKSQCLKLYCDCFANGEFCQDCTCKDCCNNLSNEDERQKAIKVCLERNPSAFKPKITSSSDLGDMRLHNKGCNCKRSGCLKNYCECYEAKIPCSSNCKCVGCRNMEDRADLDLDPIDPKIKAILANNTNSVGAAGQKRSHGQVEKYSKEIKTETETMSLVPAAIDKPQQCNFITQEVVDATIQCMITQADECEKSGLPVYQTERMVMEELGRCLVEIIDFSIRNTDNSYSQD